MLYELVIGGHLGDMILAAFPTLEARWRGDDTVLRGVLRDSSDVYGIIAELEALGLELLELRSVPCG